MIDKMWFENARSREASATLDLTDSFVDFVHEVKPYHTKIYDILMNYAFTDRMTVNMYENLNIEVTITDGGENTEPVYNCGPGYEPGYGFGYGIYWGGGYGGGNSDTSVTPPLPPTDEPFGDTPGYDTRGWDGTVITNPSNTIPPVNNVYAGIMQAVSSDGQPVGVVANTFLVRTPASTFYNVAIINAHSNQMGFVRNYTLSGVTPTDRKWFVEGDQTAFIRPEDVVFTGAARQQQAQFTVASVSYNGTSTEVVTKEGIPLTAVGNGVLSVLVTPEYLPWWSYGMAVKLSSDTPLPAPLVAGKTYYFIPHAKPGHFNLAEVRTPQTYQQYVQFPEMSNQNITIGNAEFFLPGMSVHVEGSFLNRNDGYYTVLKSEEENGLIRVYVVEPIPYPTYDDKLPDGWLTYDLREGVVKWNVCPLTDGPSLFTQVIIGERLTFEFDIEFKDRAVVSMIENRVPDLVGWGDTLYGKEWDNIENARPISQSQESSISGDGNFAGVLNGGFDTRAFDMFPFDALGGE